MSEKTPRVDPVSRDVDYAMRASDGVNVKRLPKGVHAVLVEKSAHSLAQYRALGFRKVPRTADGPFIYEDDDELASDYVEHMGHVLMTIPLEKWEQIQKHGHPSGGIGQAQYDEIEKQIVRDGGVDLMRGKMGRGIHLIPETSALHRER